MPTINSFDQWRKDNPDKAIRSVHETRDKRYVTITLTYESGRIKKTRVTLKQYSREQRMD